MEKGTTSYIKRFTTGRKCSKIIFLVAIVLAIEMIIHMNAFSGLLQTIATGPSRTVHVQTKRQLGEFNVAGNDTFGIPLANQNNSAGKSKAGLDIGDQVSLNSGGSNTVTDLLRLNASALTIKNLNVFNPTKESVAIKRTVAMDRCVRFFSERNDSVICVYPPKEDVWVSRFIVESGAWELDLLNMTRDFYAADPNLQLLDVGCNIGVFTLTAAILGHKVVALDANKVNLRMLSMSLTLNDLHSEATLIWNAVSDVYEQVEFNLMRGNIGGSFVRPVIGKARTSTVPTIRIDDLLPAFKGNSVLIKMDIEGSEWRALNGAWRFFKEIDVRYVLMEYVNHKGKESGKQIQQFFETFSFLPYKPPQYKVALDTSSDKNWPGDVLWIKQDEGR